MNLDFKAIRFVLAVIDEGSFTRAAERLHVAQPWLSTRIKRLEEYLGFAVLARSTRSVGLTAKGQELIEVMRNMVSAEDNISRAIAEMRGDCSVRIGAPDVTVMLYARRALMEQFTKTHPYARYEVKPCWGESAIEELRRDEIDLAFVFGPLPAVFAKEFAELPLSRHPLALELPAASPLSAYDQVPLEALHNLDIVIFQPRFFTSDTVLRIYADFRAAGARLMECPEPGFNAARELAMERQCALLSSAEGEIDPPGRVRRLFGGENRYSDYSVIKRIDCERPGVNAFWNVATLLALQPSLERQRLQQSQ